MRHSCVTSSPLSENKEMTKQYSYCKKSNDTSRYQWT